MNKNPSQSFECKVKDGLALCGCHIDKTSSTKKIGIAVSGGADSISLLFSLSSLLKDTEWTLYVISVNHNIRPENETYGDVLFVQDFCTRLQKEGVSIHFHCAEIKRGAIEDYAVENKCGIEAAARHFRYKSFEDFIKNNQLDFLCLAHNKDDQLETVLMRFLQSSSSGNRKGILRKRGKYIRPLLDISRAEIEEYLLNHNLSWRTDSTNLDDVYFRNKLRLKLIPFLNENFKDWQSGVLNGYEKSVVEDDFINSFAEKIEYDVSFDENNKKIVSLKDNQFFCAHKAIQLRILFNMVKEIGAENRIPYVFLQDVLKSLSVVQNSNRTIQKSFSNIEIILKKNNVLIKNRVKKHTDTLFFDIIEETGEYDYFFGKISVRKNQNINQDNNQRLDAGCKVFWNDDYTCNLELPFCVRSYQPFDVIETADGGYKKIADVYNDWQIPVEDRWKIPVLQTFYGSEQKITGILGKTFGYKNWIIKNRRISE
ncbi:MAG: tRNA lysidine(34) synthetase TilS [Treponema sp.]|nr:tRNA lysidine(34) synthetase TilS [Treponema sp.]